MAKPPNKLIFTHVSAKALSGLERLSAACGDSIRIFAAPETGRYTVVLEPDGTKPSMLRRLFGKRRSYR